MSVSGPAELGAEGVWRITTPLPYRPREVHAYLVRIADGYLLVDGGADTREAWEVLDAAVRGIAGGWEHILRQAVTHMHVDHLGLVERVVRRCRAAVTMGRLDAERRERAAASPRDEAAYRIRLLRRAGAPATLVERFGSAGGGGASFEVADRPHQPESPYRAAPDWEVWWTPGHTAGHIALFRPADGVLLCGDTVLPRVTPTIGVNQQRDDPVADYLATLARIRAREPVLALGGHGPAITAPLQRIAELERETRREGERLLDELDARRPATVWDLVQRRYRGRDLPPVLWYQAVREVRAHLDRLVALGAAARHRGTPDLHLRAGHDLSKSESPG